MWRLYQFPLCPFSRKLRLLMAEKGIAFELVRENPWACREEFQLLNPLVRTPVLRDESRNITLVDSRAITEYLEETEDRVRLISGTATDRAEIRRLVALFDETFFAGVTAPLLHERMKKRLVTREAPDPAVLREILSLAHDYLYYVDHLIGTRPWLAGSTLTLADLAAAAQISVAEYLGGLDWSGHRESRDWYLVIKSRRSFAPMLTERMDTILPPDDYADLDR